MTREKAIAFFKDMNECTYGNLEEVEMAIKALQQMPSISDDGTLMVNIEDGTKVSRVLVYSDNHFGGLYYLDQEPKIGHWISHMKHCEMNNLRPSGLGSYFWCSECGCGIENKSFSRVNYTYCPECGAKMS